MSTMPWIRRGRKTTASMLTFGIVLVETIMLVQSLAFVSLPNSAKSVSAYIPSALATLAVSLGMAAAPVMAYELIPLPYAYNALIPVIDKETMELHHDAHHAGYVRGVNNEMDVNEQPSLNELQKSAISNGNPKIRNNGGGIYNHNLYWLEMAPRGKGGTPSVALNGAIEKSFGSMKEFNTKFAAAAAGRFGSGWAWLIVNKSSELEVTSTPNQDNPLMKGVEGAEGTPIIGIDVWEHAYYLKYENRRSEYVSAWNEVINWTQVNIWYMEAMKGIVPNVETVGNDAAAGNGNDAAAGNGNDAAAGNGNDAAAGNQSGGKYPVVNHAGVDKVNLALWCFTMALAVGWEGQMDVHFQ